MPTATKVVFGGLFAASFLGMIAMSLTRGGTAKKAAINDERRDYQRYLTSVRKQVRRHGAVQRAALVFANPTPEGLSSVAISPRLWERRRADPDFGHVLVGLGPQRLASPLRAPQTAPLEDLDPVSSTTLRAFIRTNSTVPDLPVLVAIRSYPRVRIAGGREDRIGLARALMASLATFHSPDDLKIAVCAGDAQAAEWDWTKWLPHTWHPQRWGDAGPVRMAAPTLEQLEAVIGPEMLERPPFHTGAQEHLDGAHLVVVVDGGDAASAGRLAAEAGLLGVTLVFLDADPDQMRLGEAALRLVIEEGRVGVRTPSGIRLIGAQIGMHEVEATALARQMSSRYVLNRTGERVTPSTYGLTDLLGIPEPRAIDLAHLWAPRAPRDRLRIPLGVEPSSEPLMMDFKESAEQGMGPHGLVIGATGSGKSELLRTLVTGLALTHSSETLNFVLVDFKGGATFAGLSELPHTAAVITNLADDLTLVDRMQDSLHGELVRRQELLRAAGNYASVRDYERARQAGQHLEPLPTLMVIIDEFSELLSSKPDFIDLFVMIGRLGRSLAVHLLLASQRLEEGRLRGLDSHLSYRIGLRTFSASESRAVLGVPDAYELPPVPGAAYLRFDTTTLVRFKAAYVSGALPPPTVAGRASTTGAIGRRVVAFGLNETRRRPAVTPDQAAQAALEAPANPLDDTVLDVLVAQLVGQGPAPHQVWLPPLTAPPALDHLLPPLAVTPDRGLHAAGWPGNGQLSVPIGVVDKPFEQKRDLLWAPLAGAAGNLVVVGGPQSGKSTLLRSLVASMALTHTPAEVQFYGLDFGGGTLSALDDLPHVGGMAGRRDREAVLRTVSEMMTLLDSREKLFGQLRIDSMATFRARRRAETLEDRPFGDVFLVVDGWGVLRQEYDQLEEPITTLASRGLGFGIHVVLSANRWMEVRPALRDTLGTRFELRLGDPGDSEFDRRKAANVPEGAPGRGMGRDKLHFLGALPRIDGVSRTDDLSEAAGRLVSAVSKAWAGPPAPPVRLLPRMVTADRLPEPAADDGWRVPIGIGESDLAPYHLDFAVDQHFYAFGDSECGKSGMLRLIGNGVTARQPRERARLLVADYRRSLLGELEESHLAGYAASATALNDLVAQLVGTLRSRLPGPEVTPAQLRERSWWSGPELFLLVDDYDMIAGQSLNPLLPLAELLPQARDIGLHLVLARRCGGAGRAMFDPMISKLRESATPGLLMSGDKDEGALLGTVKPSAQPPGRGTLVSRRSGTQLVQLAWRPPTA